MKQRLWVPLVAVGLALVILVPTTFAVGEPGTTLYAQLGFNRFPAGQGAASASLTFLSERDVLLGIAIVGPAGTNNSVRVYVDGSCTNPGEWVINRTANAGPNGPFLEVASNSGVNTIQVNQLDVDRIRSELAGNPNETFALMVARVINGQNYRTCTPFRTTPFPPLTTTSSTSSASTQTSTVFSTGTTVRTVTLSSGLTTVTLPTTTSTQTINTTSTGLSTGTTTFLIFSPPFITSSTFTTQVTQTIASTRTTTLSGGTVTTQTGGATTFTTTSLFTTPVTTVTTTL